MLDLVLQVRLVASEGAGILFRTAPIEYQQYDADLGVYTSFSFLFYIFHCLFLGSVASLIAIELFG